MINNRAAGARGGALAENGPGGVRGGARAGRLWVEGWGRPQLLFSRVPPPQARGLPGSATCAPPLRPHSGPGTAEARPRLGKGEVPVPTRGFVSGR